MVLMASIEKWTPGGQVQGHTCEELSSLVLASETICKGMSLLC